MKNFWVLETNKEVCLNGDWFIGSILGWVNTGCCDWSSRPWDFSLWEGANSLISIYDIHLKDIDQCASWIQG